jgi:hypothetical protein
MIKVAEFIPGKPLPTFEGLAGSTIDARIVFSNDLLEIPVDSIQSEVFKTSAQILPGLRWELTGSNLATNTTFKAEAVEDKIFRRCIAFRLDLEALGAVNGDLFFVKVKLNAGGGITTPKASICAIIQVFEYSSMVI